MFCHRLSIVKLNFSRFQVVKRVPYFVSCLPSYLVLMTCEFESPKMDFNTMCEVQSFELLDINPVIDLTSHDSNNFFKMQVNHHRIVPQTFGAAVVHQNDLLQQVWRRPVEHTVHRA